MTLLVSLASYTSVLTFTCTSHASHIFTHSRYHLAWKFKKPFIIYYSSLTSFSQRKMKGNMYNLNTKLDLHMCISWKFSIGSYCSSLTTMYGCFPLLISTYSYTLTSTFFVRILIYYTLMQFPPFAFKVLAVTDPIETEVLITCNNWCSWMSYFWYPFRE